MDARGQTQTLLLTRPSWFWQNRQRPSTVPKFGVWDEQTAASAAQGFTVQFENVKRHREVARTAVPAVPRAPSPPEGAAARRAHHQKTPFVSKVTYRDC